MTISVLHRGSAENRLFTHQIGRWTWRVWMTAQGHASHG